MRIGTKSVLFGVHQFALHPLFIALGWWKAFGFARVQIPYRRAIDAWAKSDSLETRELGVELVDLAPPTTTSLLDPRLWIAFLVHDIGYLGKPNMDGAEGETHPELGATIMRRLFGDAWGDFVLLHSRYYAKRLGRPLSPLCIADKWVIVLEPSWLYLPRARASGELDEFLDVGQRRAAESDTMMNAEERAGFLRRDAHVWHQTVKAYMRRWIAEHSDGRLDTWTGRRHEVAP